MNEAFLNTDDDAFVTIVSKLLSKGVHAKRNLSVETYVSQARVVWATCETDDVYALKLLFDPVIDPTGEDEEMFCVLVARIAQDGLLLNAPEGYQRPHYEKVKFEHILIGSSISQPDPKVTATYILAFFDVLGFEAQLKRIGLSAMHALYQKLLNDALKPNSEGRPLVKSTSVVRGQPVPALMWSLIQGSYFSDSLLLWSPCNQTVRGTALIEDFCKRCSTLFCEALEMGLPLRGSITTGDAVLDKENGIYLGEPLVEAARLESKQNWVGVSFGASFKQAGLHIPTSSVFAHKPPLKEGGETLFSGLVLDWPRVWRSTRKESAVGILESYCGAGLAPHLEQRYLSAIDFYNFSEKNQDWDVPEGHVRVDVESFFGKDREE